MAYYNNWQNQNQGDSFGREYAIDWEAKTIPLFAYKSCLITKEAFLLALVGVPEHPLKIAKARFMFAIVTFFDTVEVGFVAYINGEKYASKPMTFDGQRIGIGDYEALMVLSPELHNEKKLFLMFRLLKNWAFEHGPFQTFTEQQDDVFERLEKEDAEM